MPPRSPRIRCHPGNVAAVAAVFLGLVLVACSGSPSGPAATTSQGGEAAPTTVVNEVPGPEPERFAPGDDTFFVVPDPIPVGEHGDLLRHQEITDAPDGLQWVRIMYLSETVAGEPTVVTGILTIPDGPTPTGGLRLATHAHGSTGLADDCAPSRTLEDDPASAAELTVVGTRAAETGYAVVSTDYEGQGGPGRHPFLVGVSEGRGVLDAARAAHRFPGAEFGDDLAIVGYSQGGHAALWAGQIAGTWTPEFTITGTVAGAPASEVADLIGRFDADAVDDPEAVAILGGLTAAHPDVQTDLDDILTPGGETVLEVMDASCSPPDDFTMDPPLFTDDPRDVEPWKGLLADNTPGSTPAAGPVLIVHSAEDESVPVDHSATLLTRMCATGDTVERRVTAEGTHVTAALDAYDQSFAWLRDLATGGTATSDCGS